MTEKGAAVLAVFVIALLGTAHAAYGYWTDRIGVKEEVAVVWPVEIEIEETEEENGSEMAEEPEVKPVENRNSVESTQQMESTETEGHIGAMESAEGETGA